MTTSEDFKNLVDRLPLKLRENQRVRELFEAIEETIAQRVEPQIQRILDLRSLFTAHPDDLALKLAELSGYFDDASRDLTKPLSIEWKRVEISNKNTVAAFEAMLQRINIPPAAIEYVPLHAPKDTAAHPYGSVFFTIEEIVSNGDDPDDYFLTSHVDFKTDMNKAIEYGWDTTEFSGVLERYFEENVRPTHIVFGGLKFFLKSDEPQARSLTDATQTGEIAMSRLNTE